MKIKRVIALLMIVSLVVGFMPRNIQAEIAENASMNTESTESTSATTENTESKESTSATTENTESTESTSATTENTESTENTSATTENTESTESTESTENTSATTESTQSTETTAPTTPTTPTEPYLDYLEVYQSALGTGGTRALTRHEELDEEFGGQVYMVDYGSTWSSSSFYVAAILSNDAPDDVEITMSAYDVNGEEQRVTMRASSETKKYRHKLSGTIFGAGANGAKRGLYKIEIVNGETIQKYFIIVNRVLELSSLESYITTKEESVLNEKFVKETKLYTAAIPAEATSIKIAAKQQLNSSFSMTINGESYVAGEEREIPVEKEENIVKIILEQEETYCGEAYSGKRYVSTGEYTIRIAKTAPVNTEFIVNPEDAIVCVYDAKGERVYPTEENKYLFDEVLEGETYTYQITAYGYKAQKGSFVASPEQKIEIVLDSASYKHQALTNNEWWNYRNSEKNNGVTGVSTPENAEEVTEKWAVQLGGEWSNSFTPPLLLGGALYTGSGKYIYKLNKDTGELLAVSEELKGNLVFALNSLTYAEGLLFAQIGNGQIQALSATTLESVWVSEALGGQTLSPITYKNGYIYTGTWNSETDPGTYFCLSVTDENPDKKNETKHCTWKYSHKGGFYWAGSYASDKYVVFGSDDGTQEGNYTDNSILYSVTAKEGILIDKIEGLSGDIRTSVVYHNGYIYVATKGGYLYRVKMNGDGSFGQIVSYALGGMATASPVVHKNRIYIGVCGQGGQFNADGGHHFAVLNETSTGISLAYKVPIKGYPQAGALLSTAYEHVDYDGNGTADGKVYVYFTYNAFPGGIVGFTDSPGQTEAELQTYFEPEGAKQQYCISPICVDKDGTLYYKNDSCYMMAVESNLAFLDGIHVEAEGNVTWDAEYKRSKLEYKLRVPEGTQKVTLTLDVPEGRTVSVNGQTYVGPKDIRLIEGSATVNILVQYQNKKKTYTLQISQLDKNASLSNLVISASNNIKDNLIAMNPAFSPSLFAYTSDVYDGNKKFLNIFVKTANENATIAAEPVSGVKRITRANNSAGSDGNTRFSVYFDENESTAIVNIMVTAMDGITKQSYQVTLLRTDIYAPILKDFIVTRLNEKEAFVTFTANEPGQYYYKIVDAGKEAPTFGEDQTGISLNQGVNRLELGGLGNEGKDIYFSTVDTKGNRLETPIKISIKPYKVFEGSIITNPENAQITIKDTSGNVLESNGAAYSFIDGNTYYITIEKEGYETIEEVFVADADKSSYSYELTYLLSSNAYLDSMFVSSSDRFGAGILKISPMFIKDVDNYSVSYDKERAYLNLWLKAEEEKASISVYAVSGIKGSTVNKDETISEEELVEGRRNWKVYFGDGETTAKVRIQVKAEDGTTKNYFLTLSMVDTTAPVLLRVSASRISVEKASVVFKTSEKGTYYYKVVEKGSKEPEIPRKKGKDALKGTVTISLNKLTEGEKTIYIVLVDGAENESNILKMDIPNSKTLGIKGQEGLGGKDSTNLTGKTPVLKKKSSQKDGDKSALKKNDEKKDTSMQTNNKEETANKNTANKTTGGAGNSRFRIEWLDLTVPVNQAAMGVAGVGLLYLMLWQYGCHWYKKRKKNV